MASQVETQVETQELINTSLSDGDVDSDSDSSDPDDDDDDDNTNDDAVVTPGSKAHYKGKSVRKATPTSTDAVNAALAAQMATVATSSSTSSASTATAVAGGKRHHTESTTTTSSSAAKKTKAPRAKSASKPRAPRKSRAKSGRKPRAKSGRKPQAKAVKPKLVVAKESKAVATVDAHEELQQVYARLVDVYSTTRGAHRGTSSTNFLLALGSVLGLDASETGQVVGNAWMRNCSTVSENAQQLKMLVALKGSANIGRVREVRTETTGGNTNTIPKRYMATAQVAAVRAAHSITASVFNDFTTVMETAMTVINAAEDGGTASGEERNNVDASDSSDASDAE